MICSHDLPKIIHPTRLTSHSATLIDNIFYRHSIHADTSAGILTHRFSDHQHCYITVDLNHQTRRPSEYVYTSKTSFNSLFNLKNELADFSTFCTLNTSPNDDPISNYNTLLHFQTEKRGKHFPLTRDKYNKYKHKKSCFICFIHRS